VKKVAPIDYTIYWLPDLTSFNVFFLQNYGLLLNQLNTTVHYQN